MKNYHLYFFADRFSYKMMAVLQQRLQPNHTCIDTNLVAKTQRQPLQKLVAHFNYWEQTNLRNVHYSSTSDSLKAASKI